VAIAIQKGLLKSQEWAKEDPDRYFRMTSEQSGNPLEVVLETANYDIDDSHPMNLDDRYINSLKNILKFLQDYDLTSGEVDFDSWVDDSVIEQAKGEYSIEKKAE
jgi:ABC-type nitrate/sulfonate/bicarbonate transport system substrate-binding protein